MIDSFLKKLEHQLLTLVIFIGAGSLISWSLSFQPVVRIRPHTFGIGVLSALGLILVRITFRSSLHFLKRWRSASIEFSVSSTSERIGMALVLAGGEEILLRGFVFAPLLVILHFPGGTLFAHLANLIIAGILRVGDRTRVLSALPEALFLAFLYQSYRSLFICVICRFAGELLWAFQGLSITRKLTILLRQGERNR